MKPLLICLMLILMMSCSQELPEITDAGHTAFRLNQIGYYPEAKKRFVVVDPSQAAVFQIVDLEVKKVVFKGELSESQYWELSGETVKSGEFSGLDSPGTYAVFIDSIGYSYPFEIKKNILNEAFKASIKALYFHRASFALEEKHAGQFTRQMGHPDDSVLFHPSVGRAGTVQSPGGWYDAGDFGKYVVNGAYSLGQLLVLLEQYPNVIGDKGLNIPESGNGINDYLDELKYEMDWLLTMQDEDGGVFFKLTTETFEGMILPEEATMQRYLFKKSTSAALDFAAVAAKFSRAIASIDAAYAKQCVNAAVRAWNWAETNPTIAFTNPEGVITGQYGDENFTQERYWAAAELYVATKEQAYLDYLTNNPIDFTFQPGESWANHMHYLGAFTILDHASDIELATILKTKILKTADDLVRRSKTNAYFQPISDFQWGSNSDVMNSAYLIAQAFRLDPKPLYLETVQEITDYIFGKNALGYSFLTGYGDKTPQNIHQRQSAADGIAEPLPGFLSGGPNAKKQDAHEVQYPDITYPMTTWVDQVPSFASNEICLNWNAPLTYVLGFLEQESN